MNKHTFLYPVMFAVALPFLGGCAQRGAFEQADLSALEQGFESRQTIDDVSVSVKQLTQKDKEYVFGKKNLSFSPVLMTVENKGAEDLFFDVKKQAFRLADIEISGRGSAGAMLAGSALLPAAGLIGGGALYFGLVQMSIACQDLGLFMMLSLTGLVAIPAFMLSGLFTGLSARRKIQEKRYTCMHRTKFLCKPSYVIKNKSKEYILLFFEKNKVPGGLNILLESTEEPARSLSFELKTNAGLYTNEFVN